MDLYRLLKQDHQKAKRLFERIAEAGEGAKKTRERLFQELKQELELHTRVEEEHFYPALEEFDETKDLVAEALSEHDEVKEKLAALAQIDTEDESWPSEIEELQADVEHHVEEEENEIFPKARELLDKARTEAIAGAIQEAKSAAKAK